MFKQNLAKSALLLAVPLIAAQARTVTVADHAERTMKDIQESAYNVQNESETLKTFATNMEIDNQARAELLNSMRDRLNRMGKELALLEAERSQLSLWEQQALDQTEPLLKDAAVNTEQVVEYFNAHKSPVWIGQYRDDTARISNDTQKVVSTLEASFKDSH